MQNFNLPGSSPPKYGFQKSENTRAEVTIYQHGDDPIVLQTKKATDPTRLIGNRPTDTEASVISVNTTKDINNASGTFEITVKPSRVSIDLFKRLTDDDWVDITFYVNTTPYHNFRGLIDGVAENITVNNGATSITYIISGRCFGKIWESTPIWFSPYYNDIITAALSSRVFNGIPEFFGAPDKVAIAFLKGFLEAVESNDGVNWLPPKNMPGIIGNSFLNNVNFNESVLGGSTLFQNVPKREEFNANAIAPEGVLWDLAKTYSDPTFTELYTDYLPDGDPLSSKLNGSISTGDAQMTVVMRDRPFPVLPISAPPSYKNTWDTLPEFVIQPQEIVSKSVSRGGYERYNAFFAASRIHQESIERYALNLLSPLIDRQSIKRHGFRRFDVQSNVQPSADNPVIDGGTNLDTLCNYQRQIARDWYCLNPYLLSRTIGLGHGRPDIRIGCKLIEKGFAINSKETAIDTTYYVESVTNAWTFGMGVRTTIGVTRGWLGDSDSYNTALAKIASRYDIVPLESV